MTGDQERISRLVERLAPELLAYFLRRVDPAADAADLLGQTLLVIARRPPAVPINEGEARLWAYGVARRTLATGRRGDRRRSALVERLREQVERDHGRPAGSHDALHEALASGDPVDREIIRLIHWEGFTQAEVAAIVGRPPGTVRSRYARARAELRTRLAAPHLN